MKAPEIPVHEQERMRILRGLNVLDTIPEERFERITRLAQRLFDVPIVAISLVDTDRQWFKSIQGLDIRETPREVSFCGHAILGVGPLVVPDATADARFQDNPLVQDAPSIRFYAGVPIQTGGAQIGTLCIIDRRPRTLSSEDLATLKDLTRLVEDEFTSTRLAMTDPLTGLASRRGFELLAGHAMSLCGRWGRPITVLAFDLDGFKQINDQHGHAAGDAALQEFASALQQAFRRSDICARLGGDEFCVLGIGPATAMAMPLARLRAQLDEHRPQRPFDIRFSVGSSEWDPTSKTTLVQLLADADAKLYAEKRRAT